MTDIIKNIMKGKINGRKNNKRNEGKIHGMDDAVNKGRGRRANAEGQLQKDKRIH
jgi:hypothetical protein